MRALVALMFCVGCGTGRGTVTGRTQIDLAVSTDDLSSHDAAVGPDLDDLTPGTKLCDALLICTSACTTPACIASCQSMATPSANTLLDALNSCIKSACYTGQPLCDSNSAGTNCAQCIANVQAPSFESCPAAVNQNNGVGTSYADQCHACYTQLDACLTDEGPGHDAG